MLAQEEMIGGADQARIMEMEVQVEAAAELAARGVRVNAVAPGFVETEMARETWRALGVTEERREELRKGYPLGFGRPEQVADAIAFFLGEASAWITGQCLVVDGWRSLSC